MFSCGVTKDKTYEFLQLRDTGRVPVNSRDNDSDTTSLLSHKKKIEKKSVLDTYILEANNIKIEIISMSPAFENLLKLQQQCLRPTFADSSETRQKIENINLQLRAQLESLRERIAKFDLNTTDSTDRTKVINNLHQMLNEAFRDFSFKLKMAQQTFSATYDRIHNTAKQGNNDAYSVCDFLVDESRHDGLQREMTVQRENEEIQELTRRAEEVQQLFKDLAVLIADQGTIIDRIDYNISQSLTNAEAAHDEVIKAEKYQKKSRLWICVVILGIMIFILFLLALFK